MARRHVPLRNGLSGGFDALPPTAPGGPGGPKEPIQAAAAGAPPPSSLSEQFNRAAGASKATKPPGGDQPAKPTLEERIAKLEGKRSRPAHTHEMNPLGNVIGSYDPKRDRIIGHQIKQLKAILAEQRAARAAFEGSWRKGTITPVFNCAARKRP